MFCKNARSNTIVCTIRGEKNPLPSRDIPCLPVPQRSTRRSTARHGETARKRDRRVEEQHNLPPPGRRRSPVLREMARKQDPHVSFHIKVSASFSRHIMHSKTRMRVDPRTSRCGTTRQIPRRLRAISSVTWQSAEPISDAIVSFAGSRGVHAFATAVSAFVGIYCGLNWLDYRDARIRREREDDGGGGGADDEI